MGNVLGICVDPLYGLSLLSNHMRQLRKDLAQLSYRRFYGLDRRRTLLDI